MIPDTTIQLPLMGWRFSALTAKPSLTRLQLAPEIQTLDQSTAVLPGGAYTTLRTYERVMALHLNDHLNRLQRTANLAGTPLSVNLSGLHAALHQGVICYREINPAARTVDLRLRLTIDLEVHPGEATLVIEKLTTPPPLAYAQGVAVVTRHLERILPEAKLTRFIDRSKSVRETLPAGVNEALMISNNGTIREGLSSNFFAVYKQTVFTAGQDVLAGITRGIVLDCIHKLGLPLKLVPVQLDDIAMLEEAFITSTSRGVLPIRQIDQHEIGREIPGPVTRGLMLAFDKAVLEQLEEI